MKVHFSGLTLLIIKKMKENFVVKEGKNTTYYFLLGGLFFVLFMAKQPGSNLGLLPLMLLLNIAILLYTILRFRWMASFVVFVDVDKEEIILNHSFPFKKKKILLKDVKEVDTQNGNIILFGSTPLSKWQRIVCKTKKSDDYTVRFGTIENSKRRRLMELLYTLNNETEK
jgi:hypothetical protein